MKIYKVCLLQEGNKLGDKEVFDNVWCTTECGLREHWFDQAQEWGEEENEQWADYSISSEHPEKAYEIPLEKLLEMTEKDGYSIEGYEIPEYEPVFHDGAFYVERVERNEVQNIDGKLFTFQTKQEAKQFIETLKNLMDNK